MRKKRQADFTAGDYKVDDNGYLLTWDTETVGYFISQFVKERTDSETFITYLGGGSYGKAFLVEKGGDKRIYKAVKAQDVAVSEFETLKLIREAAGELIPEPYALHEASERIPIAIIEEEYIDGVNLINPLLSYYGKKKRRALADEVAAVIAGIRRKTADGYGKVGEEKSGSWTEYYKKFAEAVLSEADEGVKDGRVKKAPVTLAKEAFGRFDEIFAEPVEKACLVHGDINIANILVERKTLKLKGIIDPYGSVFGDPEYELFQLQNMWGDRFFLYETVKNTFKTSANCDLKCAFYALINEIHCALKSGTSTTMFANWLFRKQMKRLKALLKK